MPSVPPKCTACCCFTQDLDVTRSHTGPYFLFFSLCLSCVIPVSFVICLVLPPAVSSCPLCLGSRSNLNALPVCDSSVIPNIQYVHGRQCFKIAAVHTCSAICCIVCHTNQLPNCLRRAQRVQPTGCTIIWGLLRSYIRAQQKYIISWKRNRYIYRRSQALWVRR